MTADALPGLIYEAAVDAARWPVVLEALSDEFDARSAVLVLTDAARSELDFAVASGVMADPELQAAYHRDWADRDPALALFSRMPAGRVAITSQLWPTVAEREAFPFHREFYQPAGLSDSICVSLAQEEGRKGLLALMRGRGSPDFDGADARKLSALTPHLQRSLRLHEERVRQARLEGAFAAAVERLASGIVVLDRGLRVVAANAAARRIAARGDGVSLSGDRLSFPNDPEAAAVCRRLAESGAGEDEHRLLHGADADTPYGLTVCVLPPSTPGALRDGGGVLVVIAEPRSPSPASIAAVARRFRLTPGEAALLQSLVDGRSLNEHAEARGLTGHAARFHAKRMFAKAGVRGQTDLIRACLLLAQTLEGAQP